MWKKLGYGGLVLLLIYFIYAVFFKKIPTPLEQMQKDMKAKKVMYRLKDDAIIYADEQIGSEGDEVIRFKNVIVDLIKKKMLISGKEGEVNTKTSDVTLMKKVVGTTKDKKWEIYTERVEYKKQGDTLISPVRTKLINTVDDTVSEADRVETTTKFEVIVATGHASYNNKKDKKTLTADKITYHDPIKVSDAEGHVVYKEEQTKRELRADRMRYDDINKIGNALGNVIYTDPENKLTGYKVDYYMKDERVDGQGNVVYTGKNSVISADAASYFVKKKQVDGRGHVKYTSPTLIVTGDHVFYDEIAKILNGDGNGTYNYLPRKTTGTYRSGVYDLKTETLTTNDYYTANYDDYKMDGTGLIYVFPTGDARMNGPFNVKKQNFNVHGANGTMNTISKDIFANKMEMTSVQGDRITSDTGRGSFEKKEYVHMTYKDITLDSQYNEMDSGRNLILARDKVMVDFKNNTKMTANYLYMDMNKQEGYARNNVKIVSTLPQFRTINTSADKATIYLKDKRIKLNGNVVTYQGKTQISSKSAIYDIDRRILENEGNIQMQYEVQNNEEQGKSDPKNAAATQEVIGKLSIPEGEVSTRGGINLPKSMTASNGVPVAIRWRSSNSSLFSVSGRINKQFYGGGSKGVTLTATAKAGVDTAERTFNVSVPTESAHEMLVRAAKNIYVPEDGENLPSSVRVNVNKGTIDVPISWSKNGDRNVATLRYGGASYQKQF